MKLLPALRRKPEPARHRPGAMIDRSSFFPDLEWIMDPGGNAFAAWFQQTLLGSRETIAPEFGSFTRQIYKASPIAFACIANRMSLFSEARFQFRNLAPPRELFGSQELAPLEQPWPGATTGDLLTLAELYVSLAGNFFAARRANGRIRVLRPDWVSIVLGSNADPSVGAGDIDAEAIGYLYHPGGPASGKPPVNLLPEEVCHYMPQPDPDAPYRGMSWLTPILSDVVADKAATEHKNRFWAAGATRNLIIRPDISDPDDWDLWVDKFKREHEGAANAFKTLFLASGVDVTPIGTDLQEADFARVQQAGEVRICAASMVPPSIVGVSEGLQGSALNAGNFEAAWRQFANGWARPSWRNFAGSVARIIVVPPGAELWYDDRDVPALQEDVKKRAETLREQATAANILITAGFQPDSVVTAIVTGDLSALVHTGLTSVQLLPAGAAPPPPGGAGALERVGAQIADLRAQIAEWRPGAADQTSANSRNSLSS